MWAAVGVLEINILDEGYFFEDIAGWVGCVQTAIDNRQRERLAVLKEQHRRHDEQFVDFAGNLRQLGAVIIPCLPTECAKKR